MISIEFSHILGNEKINSYHRESYELFLKLKEESPKKCKGCLFIDNYNFKYSGKEKLPFNLIDVEIYKEYDFQKFVPRLIELLGINDSYNVKFKNIILKKNGKSTCTALTSSWYLYRLGYFSDEIKYNSLVNILPKKFMNVEKNVIKILKHIDSSLSKKIRTIFLENPEGDYEVLSK